MATSRVAELRNVMEKFADFYSQKLCETDEIPTEPMRTTTKCRVLEHYVDDVKMQIEHFLTCVEKWDRDSIEKIDKMKRTFREHGEKTEFLEKQLRNSETQREQVELAVQELGVRCESLEKSHRQTKHNYDGVLNEVSRLVDALAAARVSGKLSEVVKCQSHAQQAEIARLLQAILALDSVIAAPTKPHENVSSRRSFGVQSDVVEQHVLASEKKFGEEELMYARKEISHLDEKVRELKASLTSMSQREQELVRELHTRDREIVRLKTLATDNSPSKALQQQLELTENEKSEWKAQADLYQQQLEKALQDLKNFQSERLVFSESESALAYLQRELSNERERSESLEKSMKDREDEVEMYRRRYEELMAENDRLEVLLSERNMSCSQQDSLLRAAIGEREETVEQLRHDLVHVTTLLRDQRDKARSAEDQARSLSQQLETVKIQQSTSFSTADNSENTVAVAAEQYFAKELVSKQDLSDTVRKLEMQLETTRHEKIVLEEELTRLKARSAAEQTALQHHVDRIKDELRAQEQAANKMRTDMRIVWEEKLRTEQQMREMLDTQAVDQERNRTLSALLQQREDEGGTLRNQIAMLSEQVGEKDGVIAQLRAEIGRFDTETLALQRDAENTCELVRVRDNQLTELRAAFERSCEATESAKQEFARCETALKRLADELSDTRQKAADARFEAERERTRAVAAETQVTKLDSDRLFAEQQLAAAEGEVSKLRQEVIELNERVMNLDHDCTEAHSIQEHLRMENYELSQMTEKEIAERRRCEGRLNEVEIAMRMLEEQLQAYRQDVAIRDQAILRLRAETDQAIARCQAAQEEWETKDGDVRRVAQRAREQQLELRQALDNLAMMEERLAGAEARISAISQEREVAIQDARNTENLIDQVKRDALLMKTEQETENARLRQLNDLLSVERDAAHGDVAELSQRLEHAREDIAALSRSNSDYQVEVHQLNARCRQSDILINEQSSAVSDLRQRLADANEELVRMRDEDRRATMELDTLRERCGDLSERLAGSDAKADDLDRVNSEMKCRIADLESTVIRMEADLQQARNDVRNSKARQTELEMAIIQLKDIIDNERQAAESVSFRLQAEQLLTADLKDKFARVTQDNSLLEESYSRLLADFRCYETDHRFSNGDVIERDKKIEDLETQLDTFNVDSSSAQRQISQLESTIVALRGELQSVRDDKLGIAEEMKNVEEKLSAVKQHADEQIQEWENTVRLREKEIEDLRRQNNDFHTDCSVFKEEADSHLERIHALEIDIAATTGDLQQREDIIARLEAALQEIRVELDSTRASLRESESRVNIMLGEVETAKREASEARQAHKLATSDQAAAQQKAQVAEERAIVSENEMNAKVAECVRLEGQVRRFQNELRAMQERLQDSEEDRSNMRESLQRVKGELSQARENIAKISQENSTLKQQIAKVDMEFSGIREQHKLSVDQIAHQDQILTQLQEDLRQERAKNVEASRSSAESRRVSVELRDSLSNSERQIRELQNRLSSRDHAVEDVQRELSECQAKLKQTRDELGEMEAQLRASKVSHTSAEREAQTVGERVLVFEKKVTELLAELDRTRDSLRSAQAIAYEREQDVAVLQTEITRTKTQLVEMAGQINEFNHQLGLSQQEASRLRDQCAMSGVQVTKVEEYSLALKAQLDGQKVANERVRELQGKLADTEQKLAKTQLEADALKTEIETLRSKYEGSSREIKTLKEALAAEQKENQNKFKTDAAATLTSQTKMTERQREQAHTIAKISAERDQLVMSLNQAESVLNDKETKIAEMRNHIAEQDHLIRDLVSQCARQTNTRSATEAPKGEKSSTIGSTSTSSSIVSKPMANGHMLNSGNIRVPTQVNNMSVPLKDNSRIPVAVSGNNSHHPNNNGNAGVLSPRTTKRASGIMANNVGAKPHLSPDKQHQ